MEDAVKRKLSRASLLCSIDGTTRALVSYLRDAPEDATSQSMRARLAEYRRQLRDLR